MPKRNAPDSSSAGDENMQHPYQAIETVKTEGGQTFLLAACGPNLTTLRLDDNTPLSEWPPELDTLSNADPPDSGRPAKKQKTSQPATPKNSIKLAIAPNNLYATVITEDKSIHVLTIDESGKLESLSQRTMPKRPCALQFLPDSTTILLGDKFGDVYSLPLLPLEKEDYEAVPGASQPQATTSTNENDAKTFKPSATVLTVHTQRNRKALEAQLKQKKNMTPKSKEPLTFEHKLLLGHVSMLTDMLTASRDVDGKRRDYIITADRDEHIRVSRGIPQAHIIEGFCLAHTQFVSKLCPIPGSETLISGGGDEWLGVWHWPSYTLRKKLDLRKALSTLLPSEATKEIAVSGLWTIPTDPGNKTTTLLVAIETLPALFAFQCTAGEFPGTEPTVIKLEHAPLDITHVGNKKVIVTLDARHESQQRLQALTITAESADGEGEMQMKLQSLNERRSEATDAKALDGLLYGIANLRKRGNADEDGGGREE